MENVVSEVPDPRKIIYVGCDKQDSQGTYSVHSMPEQAGSAFGRIFCLFRKASDMWFSKCTENAICLLGILSLLLAIVYL